MVLTPEVFVKTDFGMGVGCLLLILGVLSVMKSSDAAKRSSTGVVLALISICAGGYIVARYFGYDL